MDRREFGQKVVCGGLAAVLTPAVIPNLLHETPALSRVEAIKRVCQHQLKYGHQPPSFDPLFMFVERLDVKTYKEAEFKISSFHLSDIETCGREVDPDTSGWDGPTLECPIWVYGQQKSWLPILRKVKAA